MDNITPTATDFLRSYQRLQELDTIVADMTHSLGGTARVIPGNAPEFLQKLAIPQEAVGANRAFIRTPVPGGGQLRVPEVRQMLQAATAEREIARAAAALNSGAMAVNQMGLVPKPSVLPTVPGLSIPKLLAAAGPIMTMLELLTNSPELNKNEGEELARRKSQSPTIDKK